MPNTKIDDLLKGHHHFARQSFNDEGVFLRRLASEGQNPSALYIGCSDSRVVPEVLTSSSPGQLFVVRNVANLVPPLAHADASVGAALDFAVGHLRVPHLVVCGHDGCGGVKGVFDGTDFSEFTSLHEWLQAVEPAVAAVDPRLSSAARLRQAVELNVLNQLENLLSFPVVRAAIADGDLQLHGWVYDMSTLGLRVYDAGQQKFVAAIELL